MLLCILCLLLLLLFRYWFDLLLQKLAVHNDPGRYFIILTLVLFGDKHQLLLYGLGESGRGGCGGRRPGLLIINTEEVLVEQTLAVPAAALISDVHWQTELQVESAHLADVLLFAAGQAHAGSFVDALVALPLEDGEGAEADAALLAEVFLEHAQVGGLSVALVAGHGEVGGLPALLVDASPGGHSSFSFHS